MSTQSLCNVLGNLRSEFLPFILTSLENIEDQQEKWIK